MELWIRSQDKKLLMKSTELRYNQKKEDYSILAYDTKGDYRLLGIYKSKERALEVLDEIQDLLQNAYVGNANRIFYQMPQEWWVNASYRFDKNVCWKEKDSL